MALSLAEPSADVARPFQGRDRGAESPAPHPTWRVGEFETDARMLFCRTTPDHQVARLAIVDGSLVRVAGRRDLQLALPRIVPSFAVDYATEDDERTMDQGLRTRD